MPSDILIALVYISIVYEVTMMKFPNDALLKTYPIANWFMTVWYVLHSQMSFNKVKSKQLQL
jgi:glycopeptide antibiotics resistance protein